MNPPPWSFWSSVRSWTSPPDPDIWENAICWGRPHFVIKSTRADCSLVKSCSHCEAWLVIVMDSRSCLTDDSGLDGWCFDAGFFHFFIFIFYISSLVFFLISFPEMQFRGSLTKHTTYSCSVWTCLVFFQNKLWAERVNKCWVFECSSSSGLNLITVWLPWVFLQTDIRR